MSANSEQLIPWSHLTDGWFLPGSRHTRLSWLAKSHNAVSADAVAASWERLQYYLEPGVGTCAHGLLELVVGRRL